MKSKHGIVVAALISSLALSVPALAQGGPGKGQGIQKQTQMNDQKRLRDGSCNQSGIPTGQKAKKGKTYSPGDSTGYQEERPNYGTGYGAPINR
jgi:hypothetical protein